MNIADSEKVAMMMLQSWISKTADPMEADIIIFNTCSVRKKWEDKVFSLARDLQKAKKKLWQKCIVWITWCMVRKTWIRKWLLETHRKRNAAKKIEILNSVNDIYNSDDKIFWMTEVIDFVFRIEEITYLAKLLSILLKVDIWNDEKFNEYLKIKQLQSNPWSANIIIQTWCDNYCTYCIVPHTRWKETSRNSEEILSEIKQVAAKWTKEITLIWQNVNSYRKDARTKEWDVQNLKWINTSVKTPMRELLEKIDSIEWIDRVRFTSSNPHDMTKDILDAHFDLNKTCNHLHFALQSWDNEILKKMNRKHTYEDFKEMVKYLRSKDQFFSISTDIIVWFPWESESQFENTVNAFNELEFDFAYIARYSPRRGTYSADKLTDDVEYKEKARRWHKLNNMLYNNVKKRSEMMIWKNETILIEWTTEHWKYFWRTRNYKEIYFENTKKAKIWDLVEVKIEKMLKWTLSWIML